MSENSKKLTGAGKSLLLGVGVGTPAVMLYHGMAGGAAVSANQIVFAGAVAAISSPIFALATPLVVGTAWGLYQAVKQDKVSTFRQSFKRVAGPCFIVGALAGPFLGYKAVDCAVERVMDDWERAMSLGSHQIEDQNRHQAGLDAINDKLKAEKGLQIEVPRLRA